MPSKKDKDDSERLSSTAKKENPDLERTVFNEWIASLEIEYLEVFKELKESGLLEQFVKVEVSLRKELLNKLLKILNPEPEQRRLRVFLCHSKSDKTMVRQIYNKLAAEGWITPWFDEEDLVAGYEWEPAIVNAIKASQVVIVCLSNSSVTKEGYFQKEITRALAVAEEKPEDTIFLVPVKLEECIIPKRIQRWQWINYYEEGGYDRLVKALRVRAESLGIPLQA